MPQSIQGSLAQVGAGLDISVSPANEDPWRLLAFRAKLTTSVVVANRWPHFQIKSKNGDVLHEIVPVAAQAASLGVTYSLIGGNGSLDEGSAAHDGVSSLPLPDFWFPPGAKIVSLTTLVDVGDVWSNVFWMAMVGEEFEHLRLLQWIADSIGH
jgi:hypothetical protein